MRTPNRKATVHKRPAARRSSPRVSAPRAPRAGLPRLDTRSLPGPENVTRRELPNGIVVLARENFASPSVVISGSLRVGALNEPWDGSRAGLADFTASALMRGSEHYDFGTMYEQIESVGARLGVSGGTHTTGFSGKCLAEDLGKLFEILADVLRRPTFPADQVERLRGELLTGLAQRDQNTGAVAGMAFDELAYPGHPYAIPDDGSPATIGAIPREDLAAFHRRHFGPRQMMIAVVGGIPVEQAGALAQEHFGDWENPDQPVEPELPPLAPMDGVREKRVPLPGKSQSDLILGVPGPARRDPEFLAALLGNSVLGQFGMYGRIGDAVREAAGLAYYSYSTLGGGLGPAPWDVIAGVNPANVELAVELIRAEIRKFTAKKVAPSELADVQANFIGRLPLQLESNEGVAGALLNTELYGLGLDYYQRLPGLIQAVTREAILDAARKHLHPDHYVLAVAGPAANSEG